jgi:5-deoxy-5-amino-3-dehydroquinate dehydratase
MDPTCGYWAGGNRRSTVATRCWKLLAYQSDAESELIRIIEDHYDCVCAVVNPAALMMNGWGLRDALASFPAPWVEVHLSNVWARESFRHESVISPLARGVIAGLGSLGYVLAARALLAMVPD